MKFIYEIPEGFWGLFRSVNRDTYIEALLKINEEYQYNNYYISKEVCIQILGDFFSKNHVMMGAEEDETDLDTLETPGVRVLNWLIKRGWLKKLEDYSTLTTNILIPDYTAVFLEAFEHLTNEEIDETEVYIQNIYATIFSFKNDKRSNVGLLKTALINTKKLNKVLQDMLHNMDKFFGELLEKQFYGEVLKEHLDGYVEEVVRKKYHILKTSDNFYMFKTDIKSWLNDMRNNLEWVEATSKRTGGLMSSEEILDMMDEIERGFYDIEHRIANMDREHSKYVRATVMRLNYLLNQDDSIKGLMIQLVNEVARSSEMEESLIKVADKMNLSSFQVLTSDLLYKKRKNKSEFAKGLVKDDVQEELTEEEILRLNKIQNRYSKKQVEQFVEGLMKNGRADLTAESITKKEDFEKLILAYDYSIRKDSKYMVLEEEFEIVENKVFSYPKLTFVKRTK